MQIKIHPLLKHVSLTVGVAAIAAFSTGCSASTDEPAPAQATEQDLGATAAVWAGGEAIALFGEESPELVGMCATGVGCVVAVAVVAGELWFLLSGAHIGVLQQHNVRMSHDVPLNAKPAEWAREHIGELANTPYVQNAWGSLAVCGFKNGIHGSSAPRAFWANGFGTTRKEADNRAIYGALGRESFAQCFIAGRVHFGALGPETLDIGPFFCHSNGWCEGQ